MRPVPRQTLIILLLILTLALALRTWGLRSLVYANPDEALWSYFVVTSAQLSPLSPEPSQNALARILSWDYGYPLFVLDYVYVRALEALRVPITEATLPLPLAVLGTGSCLLVFLVTKRVGRLSSEGPAISRPAVGDETGFPAGLRSELRTAGRLIAGPSVVGPTIAAALMAVMPLTVGRSRSIGGAEACSGFLFLLAALQLMRYLERPGDRRRQWFAGLCVGLYLCGDVQFLVGGAVLVALVLVWPMGSRLEAAPTEVGARLEAAPTDVGARLEAAPATLADRARLLWRPGVLLPPLVLFLPYVPAWLYAIKLGYPEQTYLGTVFWEHKADWGFHLLPFLRDLGMNMGLLPLPVALVAVAWLAARRRADGRVQWLLAWLGLAAFPFLFAVTSKVTEASGYQEHLVAGLAVAVGVWVGRLTARTAGRPIAGPSIAAATIVVAAALVVTAGALFRVEPPVRLWPSPKIPYGGLVPNSGMKAAGYWVRQNVPPDQQVFVAHDPAVAYWYMGRECITGGLVAEADRKQALLANAPTVSVAVIPGQEERYPPNLMRRLGFAGRVVVTHLGQTRLNIYVRRNVNLLMDTTLADREYQRQYHTARAMIPPRWPYVPGKSVTAGSSKCDATPH